MKNLSVRKNGKGFTLTELLAAIVIMSILIGMAVPVYFAVSKNARVSEYDSKKSYYESLAVRYAEENAIYGATRISVARLVASGYATAEKYVDVDGQDIPFISNPIDEEDNLACHILDLSVDNYEYNVTMSDESNCSFAVDEEMDAKMGIKVYEYQDGKIGNQLTVDKTVVDWTNKDVIIVVNPEYENIKSLTIGISGSTKLVDLNNMLTPSMIVKGQSVDTTKSNIEIINASLISRQMFSASLQVDDTIKISQIELRIDKEAPLIDAQKFSGWTSRAKGATIYLSDGAGSGSKGVYISETENFENKDNTLKLVEQEGEETVSISRINGKELTNQRYYLWAVDKAGNVSGIPTYIDISNIDDDDPITRPGVKIESNKAGYNSNQIRATIEGDDGTGSGVVKVCISNRSSISKLSDCTWHTYGTNSGTAVYTIPNTTEGSGQKNIQLYGYVQDAVGNFSKQGVISNKYDLYTKCTKTTTVDGTKCAGKCDYGTKNLVGYDYFLSGVRCTNADKSSGGSKCYTGVACCISPNIQYHTSTQSTGNGLTIYNSTATWTGSYAATYAETYRYTTTETTSVKPGSSTSYKDPTSCKCTGCNHRPNGTCPSANADGSHYPGTNCSTDYDLCCYKSCTCPSGYSYDSGKGKCKKTKTSGCPDDYWLNSKKTKCITYVCSPGYVKVGNVCIWYSYTCPWGGVSNGYGTCNQYNYSCPRGGIVNPYDSGQCIAGSCPGGYDNMGTSCPSTRMTPARCMGGSMDSELYSFNGTAYCVSVNRNYNESSSNNCDMYPRGSSSYYSCKENRNNYDYSHGSSHYDRYPRRDYDDFNQYMSGNRNTKYIYTSPCQGNEVSIHGGNMCFSATCNTTCGLKTCPAGRTLNSARTQCCL